jgi:hypothetical protein
MIFNLFDFIKKDNPRNEDANTGISAKNSKNMNGSYNIPTNVGTIVTNPSINRFCLLSIIIY